MNPDFDAGVLLSVSHLPKTNISLDTSPILHVPVSSWLHVIGCFFFLIMSSCYSSTEHSTADEKQPCQSSSWLEWILQ